MVGDDDLAELAGHLIDAVCAVQVALASGNADQARDDALAVECIAREFQAKVRPERKWLR